MPRLAAVLRTLVAACVAVTATAASAVAQQPVTLDFSPFRRATTTEFQAVPGGDVYQGGFGFFASFGTGARNALGTWGVNDPRPDLRANVPANLGPTRAALWATQFNEQINVFREDDRAFDLFSIDVGHMYSSTYLLSGDLAPISLTFSGLYALGGSITQTFTIPIPPLVGGVRTPVLTTLAFDSRWRGLDQFGWVQGGGSSTTHQFSSVTLAVVPEPGTSLLVGTGLLLVGVVARRRRTA
jgi:hypothetical protein